MSEYVPARHGDARRITTAALLAALLCVSALLSVWIQPVVPVTLQVLVVVLIALLVRPAWAALAVGAYLLVGAVGLPVFAGMRGGIAILLGPTGGYLFGFLAGAVAGAWVRERLEATRIARIAAAGIAAAIVIAIVYLLGWAQLATVTGMGAGPALIAGVVPFLLPDALKAVAAVVLATAVRRVVRL